MEFTNLKKISNLNNQKNQKNQNLTLKKFFLILTIFSTMLFDSYFSKSCGHSKLKKIKKSQNKKRSETKMVPLIDAEYDPEDLKTFKDIRILTDFTDLVSKNAESRHLTEKIKTKIIPKTMQVLSELFKVRRIKSITLNEERCASDYKIPESVFKDQKKETDLIVLVNYDQSGLYEKHKIEASAIHCFQDKTTKRPIVGLVTFRDTLKVRNEVDIDYLVWLTIHEISHVLLFNEDLYPSFIDQELKPRNIQDIIFTEVNKFGQKIDYVKTPKVMQIAKKHYKCPNIKGVPLEYNGGDSAIGGHWSRRALNTDYMIGRSHGENLISPFTLAFFEDSGWYKSDFKKASMFFWGKNKGCDFFYKNCVKDSKIISSEKKSFIEILKKHENKKEKKIAKKYRNSMEGDKHTGWENISIKSTVVEVQTHYKKEFCEEINQPVCSQHNKFRGYCGARLFNKDLPEKDRHFQASAKIGGFDLLINYCPIVVENKFNQKFYGGSCEVGSKQDLLNYEKIGKNSGCFLSSLEKGDKIIRPYSEQKTAFSLEVYSVPKLKESRAACIEYLCEKGEIYVKIENMEVHCPSNGTAKVPSYGGELKCPDKKVMCHKKYKCKFGCTNVE